MRFIVVLCSVCVIFFSGTASSLSEPSPMPVRSPGKWVSGAGMAQPRAAHTATLLPDGKILAAGGLQDWYEFGLVIPFAETYDSSINQWESAGPMKFNRAYHTATLLSDGTVLAAGGWNGTSSSIPSAEIYDPKTRTWSQTSSLSQRRLGHTVTLLRDGRVLAAGGVIDFMDTINSAEIYDPETKIWTPIEPMPTTRGLHTATLLSNGCVLVSGGVSGSRFLPAAGADLFDPTTGRWSGVSMGDISPTKDGCAMQLPVCDHPVFFTGGWSLAGYPDFSSLYFPETGTWQNHLSPLGFPRAGFSLTCLPTAELLAVGGINPTGFPDPEICHISDMVWKPAPLMKTNRSMHTATLLPDGRVLVAGGIKDDIVLSQVEIFCPTVHYRTTPVAGASIIRNRHTATLLPTGEVLVAGGQDTIGLPLGTSEIYHPESDQWENGDVLSMPRYDHTVSTLRDQVMVIGGVGNTGVLCSTEIFEANQKRWVPAPSMAHKRARHRSVELADGKILVTGGNDGTVTRSSCEIYDPDTMTWESVPDMREPREGHTASLLKDGRILITGGKKGSIVLSSAEMFDPSTRTWFQTQNMKAARVDHHASPLPDGRMMITGGKGKKNFLKSCEIFNPNGEDWEAAPDLPQARSEHISFLIRNRTLLVVGGNTSNPGKEGIVLSYDPGMKKWSQVADLQWKRRHFSAAVLADSRIFLSGGELVSCRTTLPVQDEILNCDTPESVLSLPPYLNTVTWEPLASPSVSVTGSGFRGHGMCECAGGDFRSSPTNIPILQLTHLSSGHLYQLFPDPCHPFTDTVVRAPIPENFPVGLILATVFVNGQPSNSRMMCLWGRLQKISFFFDPPCRKP